MQPNFVVSPPHEVWKISFPQYSMGHDGFACQLYVLQILCVDPQFLWYRKYLAACEYTCRNGMWGRLHGRYASNCTEEWWCVMRLVDIIPLNITTVRLVDFDFDNECRRAHTFLKSMQRTTLSDDDCEPECFRWLSKPAIITTDAGDIIAWYLPEAVSNINQVGIHFYDSTPDASIQIKFWTSLKLIQTSLVHGMTSSTDEKMRRTSQQYFRADAEVKGCINLSPSWFQQGGNVRLISISFAWPLNPYDRVAMARQKYPPC